MSRTDNTRLACEDGNVQRLCGKGEKERKDQMGWDVEENGAGRGEEKKPSTTGTGTGGGGEKERFDSALC